MAPIYQEVYSLFQISMNAPPTNSLENTIIMPTTVTLTPTVPTPRARSTARVTRDTLETESRAWVQTCLHSMALHIVQNVFTSH